MEELSDFYKLNVNQSYAWGTYLMMTTLLPIGVTAAVGGPRVERGDCVVVPPPTSHKQPWVVGMDAWRRVV